MMPGMMSSYMPQGGAVVGRPGHAAPVGGLQVGAPQVGAPQVGAPQVGASPIGALQVGAPEAGLRREKQPPAGAVMCSIHLKTRGPNNVQPMFPGSDQWRCKPGSECKMPEAQIKHDGPIPPGNVVCVYHNKTRGPNNVEETFPGSNQWKCRPGSECKMPEMKPEQALGMPAPIHPPEPMTCWAHLKKRSPNQLHKVNTPIGAQWECLPQFKCKGTAGVAAPPQVPTGGYSMQGGMDTNAYMRQAMLMGGILHQGA